MIGTEFEIVRLASGVATLRSNLHRETFHPVIGPMAEAAAIHIGPQNLGARAVSATRPFVIWDVGLGAAANAICSLEALARGHQTESVALHSFDRTLDPLRFALAHAAALDYVPPWERCLRDLMESQQATVETVTSRVEWTLHLGDFRETVLQATIPAPDAIFYDPYSPAANPEMWSLAQFTRLFSRLASDRPCLLTCYSRSTAVRVTLLLAGFFVGIGSATGDKDQTTVASNAIGLLRAPLPADWLQRVRRSSNGAPLPGLPSFPQPISGKDFDQLLAHPQFGVR